MEGTGKREGLGSESAFSKSFAEFRFHLWDGDDERFWQSLAKLRYPKLSNYKGWTKFNPNFPVLILTKLYVVGIWLFQNRFVLPMITFQGFGIGELDFQRKSIKKVLFKFSTDLHFKASLFVCFQRVLSYQLDSMQGSYEQKLVDIWDGSDEK